ncbi:MAG TPA: AraC family transcriptional regulator, partial [Polyangiaceae bacterium]|nr:AraC family transcriptional regulator [Polyangiaceae bacterium]
KYSAKQRGELNLRAMPELALVALTVGQKDESDPVDEVIRRYEFQRACARLARTRGNTASGPLGDHGIIFLQEAASSEARSLSRLQEIGERAAALARRQFQLRLHVGFGPVAGKASLPVRFQLALAAAERALVRGARQVQAPPAPDPSEHALRNARAALAQHSGPPAGKLAVRFERYVDLVASHCGYRMEPSAAHLEAGFEWLAAPFRSNGSLEMGTYDDLCAMLERTTKNASTLSELFAAYRSAAVDLEQAIERPVVAHRERNLRRAVAFIREHATEPLTLTGVARVAGFAPAYFSRLFKQRERVTFEQHLTELRVGRAKQMLASTALSSARIAQLAGFASSQYFHRVFKRETGKTPLEYRRHPRA